MRDAIDPQWYAIRVMPQREYVVAYLLRKQGNATFVPTEIRSHKRSSYSKGKADFAVTEMPGIVFTGFPGPPAWYNVMRNHMILGPISLTSNGEPTRLDFLELMRFFSGVHDGCMFIDDEGLRLIHIPGRPPVRALTTRAKTVSQKKRPRSAPKQHQSRTVPATVPPPRKYADFLSRFVHGGTV